MFYMNRLIERKKKYIFFIDRAQNLLFVIKLISGAGYNY